VETRDAIETYTDFNLALPSRRAVAVLNLGALIF